MNERLREEAEQTDTKQLTLEDLKGIRGGAGEAERGDGDMELLGVKSEKLF